MPSDSRPDPEPSVNDLLTSALLQTNDQLLGLYELLRQPSIASGAGQLMAGLAPTICRISGAAGMAFTLPSGEVHWHTNEMSGHALRAAASGAFGYGVVPHPYEPNGFDLLVRGGGPLAGTYAFAAAEMTAPFVQFADAIVTAMEGFLGMERLHQHELALALMEQDARKTAEVAAAVLTGVPSSAPGIEAAARCVPARIGGGDFYVWLQRPDAIVMGVGDVAGKGLPASVVMTLMSEGIADLLHDQAQFGESTAVSPARLLSQLGRLRYHYLTRTGLFVTLMLAVWRPREQRLIVANAGHSPVVVRRQGRIDVVGATAPPIGVIPELGAVDQELAFDPGDVLVVGSDGLVEQADDQGRQVGYERFHREIAQAADTSPAALLDQLFQLAADQQDDTQDDDRTALVVRRRRLDEPSHDDPDPSC